jgi:hypothetical protein
MTAFLENYRVMEPTSKYAYVDTNRIVRGITLRWLCPCCRSDLAKTRALGNEFQFASRYLQRRAAAEKSCLSELRPGATDFQEASKSVGSSLGRMDLPKLRHQGGQMGQGQDIDFRYSRADCHHRQLGVD